MVLQTNAVVNEEMRWLVVDIDKWEGEECKSGSGRRHSSAEKKSVHNQREGSSNGSERQPLPIPWISAWMQI
jgi:hypothetical protein